ncbi:MAG: pseudoazurin [Jannaschia sp.]
MCRTVTTATIALSAFLSCAAQAETVEVQMLNRGEKGAMVFEPDFLRITPGDTVKFIATDKTHNAESILEMMPEGAEAFKGRINEEIEFTPVIEGIYGIKCTPHFAMGMVMTVAVGDVAEIPENYFEGRIPRKAQERFSEQIELLTEE